VPLFFLLEIILPYDKDILTGEVKEAYLPGTNRRTEIRIVPNGEPKGPSLKVKRGSALSLPVKASPGTPALKNK